MLSLYFLYTLYRKENIKKRKAIELKAILEVDGTRDSKGQWVYCHPSLIIALKVKKLAEFLDMECRITKRYIGGRILNYLIIK